MNLSELQAMVGEWSVQTFGPELRLDSLMAHLAEEINELMASREPEEAADCVILILSFAHRSGFSLEEAILQKHHVNMTREWYCPNGDGYRKHRPGT